MDRISEPNRKIAKTGGERAARDNRSRLANPYRKGTPHYDVWHEAWVAESERLETVVNEAVSELDRSAAAGKVYAAIMAGITNTRPDIPPAERMRLADAIERTMLERGLIAL